MKATKEFSAVLKGIWIFGLFAWGYTVANINIYPSVQLEDLSYYVPVPENLFAVSTFIIAFIAFVAWEATK